MNNVVRFRSPEQFREPPHDELVSAGQRPIRRSLRLADDPVLAPTDDLLRQRISDELDYAWRQLDFVAASMSRDAVTKARYRSSLQDIDCVGQNLGQLAVVLRSSMPELAVDRVPMAELRRRLQRTGGVA